MLRCIRDVRAISTHAILSKSGARSTGLKSANRQIIRLPLQTGKPCKTGCSYLKNEPVWAIFLLHKCDQRDKMKLSAKFKKNLWSGFRATLNFQLVKVALNALHTIFKLCRKFHSGILITFRK